jgi:hypothetical protein
MRGPHTNSGDNNDKNPAELDRAADNLDFSEDGDCADVDGDDDHQPDRDPPSYWYVVRPET